MFSSLNKLVNELTNQTIVGESPDNRPKSSSEENTSGAPMGESPGEMTRGAASTETMSYPLLYGFQTPQPTRQNIRRRSRSNGENNKRLDPVDIGHSKDPEVGKGNAAEELKAIEENKRKAAEELEAIEKNKRKAAEELKAIEESKRKAAEELKAAALKKARSELFNIAIRTSVNKADGVEKERLTVIFTQVKTGYEAEVPEIVEVVNCFIKDLFALKKKDNKETLLKECENIVKAYLDRFTEKLSIASDAKPKNGGSPKATLMNI